VIYFHACVWEPHGVRGILYLSIDARFGKIEFSFIDFKELKIQGSKLKIKQMFSSFCLLTSRTNLNG
jgi:hypothetical protein